MAVLVGAAAAAVRAGHAGRPAAAGGPPPRLAARRAGRLLGQPAAHPDFAWAWVTRFLVQLGNALGTLYLLYFLRDQVAASPTRDGGLLVLILVYTGGLTATTVIAGRVSDRTGRRKPS